MRHHRWPSFIGALNSKRSSFNTTRRVNFYVIVKMWFKLPIYMVYMMVYRVSLLQARLI